MLHSDPLYKAYEDLAIQILAKAAEDYEKILCKQMQFARELEKAILDPTYEEIKIITLKSRITYYERKAIEIEKFFASKYASNMTTLDLMELVDALKEECKSYDYSYEKIRKAHNKYKTHRV